MSMSKKDYEAIAKIIKYNHKWSGYPRGYAAYFNLREYYPEYNCDQLEVNGIALGIAKYCKEDNLNFDMDRFIDACGLKGILK